MNPVQKILSAVDSIAPFGKFERLTAGFSMAIPFFLLVTGAEPEKRNLALLAYPIGITLFLPFIIPFLFRINKKSRKYHGLWLTLGGGLLLFWFYWQFTRVYGIQSKPSISAYVTMEDSHLFGMVLSIAAMLFMTNGVVYWKEQEVSEARWRKWINIALGILLLGVVIFPCTTMSEVHNVFAGLFFAGCAIGTTFRKKATTAKPNESTREHLTKKISHWFFDLLPIAVMAGALLMSFGIIGPDPGPVNLFGAESIALWITGVDFVLVSLKREPKTNDDKP